MKKGYSSVSRHLKVTAQYAEVVRELAREYEDKKVVLVDLWEAMMEARLTLTPEYDGQSKERDEKGLRKLLVDGLHLTGAGYQVFLDLLLTFVGKDWAADIVEDASWVFP